MEAFSALENNIYNEINRRKAIGFHFKEQLDRMVKSENRNISDIKMYQEKVLALIKEASEIIKSDVDADNETLRVRYAQLVQAEFKIACKPW